MNVLLMTVELLPFMKIGGLADYSHGLATAINKKKEVDFKVLIPGYPSVIEAISSKKEVMTVKSILNPCSEITIWEAKLKEFAPKVLIAECEELYSKPGSPYIDDKGNPWKNNFDKFITFCMIPYLIIKEGYDWNIDLVHANDWHSGLYANYLNLLPQEKQPKTLFAIHNLSFQGNFTYQDMQRSGLNWELWHVNKAEYFNKFSFLKAAINFSDKIVAVSPRYAEEMTSDEKFGCGFKGILKNRKKSLYGILNGADYTLWNPAKDKALKHNFDAKTLSDKQKQKIYFQTEIKLPTSKNSFMIGSVTRLTEQKGIDFILKILKKLLPLHKNMQYVCVGTGEKDYETQFEKLALQYPQQVKFFNIYDEILAHKVIGSSDAFLIPSRFEPCGLTQIYALKYGTLPIVTPVGGLYDTISPIKQKDKKITGTGFISKQVNEQSIFDSIQEAFHLFKKNKKLWNQIMQNAMKANFSWTKSAKKYLEIYQSNNNTSNE